jgi:hypothetical protein
MMSNQAMGKPESHNRGENNNMGVVFGSTFVAQLVQATSMALVLSSFSHPNMGKGALTGDWSRELVSQPPHHWAIAYLEGKDSAYGDMGIRGFQ